jgi:hypothetical protein
MEVMLIDSGKLQTSSGKFKEGAEIQVVCLFAFPVTNSRLSRKGDILEREIVCES